MKNFLKSLKLNYSGITDPELILAHRLFVFTSLSVVAMTLFFGVTYFIYGFVNVSYAQFVISLTAFLSFLYFVKSGNYKGPIRLILSITWIASLYRVYNMGGITAPTFYTYTIIPVYTGAILGIGEALFWTGLFVSIPMGFHFYYLQGGIVTTLFSESELASARIYGIFFSSAVVLGVMIFVKNIFQKFRRLLEVERDEKATLLKLVSHDLANPFTVLNFTIMQIEKNLNNEEALRKNLQKSKMALGKATKIIENMRRIEAIKSGKLVPQKNQVSLFQVSEQIADFSNAMLESKDLKLEMKLPDKDIQFLCDFEIIHSQILNNLISNAVKFSHRGGVIQVSLNIENSTFKIEVKDFGVGIPEARRKVLFNSKVATTTLGTSGEYGTGFGMPIVKSVVEILNGQISFNTKTFEETGGESGTSFFVEIPIEIVSV